jgi:hypothetical protein
MGRGSSFSKLRPVPAEDDSGTRTRMKTYTLPGWLDDALHGQRWTLAGAPTLLWAAFIAWYVAGADAEPAPQTQSVRVLATGPARPACPGAFATVVQSDRRMNALCSSVAAEASLIDGNAWRYVFRDAQGQALVIELDADGVVRRVALGDWMGCRQGGCSGVRSRTERGVPGSRTFSFTGTVLMGDSPSRVMGTLNGTLTSAR